ncbi:PREDICTED: uncharacterized protein LOC109581193 [Amphimedon queenslandica]|uniref:G-protein coupled receptors family 2 profile 2 domain-containing protein n=1 Tax=Amphimedon queenslandica TaxID=400682 RepID=A0A1X7V540_AMPQE|nr:PREDICTED: uncharacterized protein LOC109581193 [Amphimedon queenslandica]|eukprot:XP_019850624.1 PREDICTED: uncharacterized protein LOC109581193 [Amphimedon queenslandica]
MSNLTNESCINFGSSKYNIALGLRSGLSFLSCGFIFCMLLIILLFKKYKFFSQRLLLYLALSCMLNLLTAGLNLYGTKAYNTTSSFITIYCKVAGFSEQITIWWTIMATFCIVIALFIKAVCGRTTSQFEFGYVLIIFVFPLIFSWIPFYYDAYGPDDMFCWIREVNLSDCNNYFKIGMILRYTLYYVPLTLLMLLLVALYIPAVIIAHKKKSRWSGNFDPEAIAIRRMIAMEIRPLIYYPLIVLVINVFPLLKQLYATINDATSSEHDGLNHNLTTYFTLSVISYVIYPFQGVLVTLAFTLDPETRKLLTWKRFVAAFLQTCCCRSRGIVRSYSIVHGRSDSLNYGSTSRDRAAVTQDESCDPDGLHMKLNWE